MAIGFKKIDMDLVANGPQRDLAKAVELYNKNNSAIKARVTRLENFAKELEYSLGKTTAQSLVITPKVASYTKYTTKDGLPQFPEIEVKKIGIKEVLINKYTGKQIRPEKLQSYIYAQDNFYNDEANKTSLAGVNGVYYQVAEYLNMFLDKKDQISMKAYRFKGGTKKRALQDIKDAVKKLTDKDGNYKLMESDLNRAEFWDEWNKFKENFGSNVYRNTNNKMQDVKIFARDLYSKRGFFNTPAKITKKDGSQIFNLSKTASPAQVLRYMGYKNFSEYLKDINAEEGR